MYACNFNLFENVQKLSFYDFGFLRVFDTLTSDELSWYNILTNCLTYQLMFDLTFL